MLYHTIVHATILIQLQDSYQVTIRKIIWTGEKMLNLIFLPGTFKVCKLLFFISDFFFFRLKKIRAFIYVLFHFI